MHLHELLQQHPHLTARFTDKFGKDRIQHVLELGRYYRLTTGYALVVDPRSEIPAPGEPFAIATRSEEEILWIRLHS